MLLSRSRNATMSSVTPAIPANLWGAWVLETQMGALRTRIKTHPDAGAAGMRSTFLTEAGEHTDPFTLQYVAEHDNIERLCAMFTLRPMRFSSSFCGWPTFAGSSSPRGESGSAESVQNPVQSQSPLTRFPGK